MIIKFLTKFNKSARPATENFKILLKDIKVLSKCKDIPCSWIGRLDIVKTAIFPKLLYRYNIIPNTIPIGFFVDIDKLILKFTWKNRGPRIAKTILKKRNKAEGLTHLNFKTYYKATSSRPCGTGTRIEIKINGTR